MLSKYSLGDLSSFTWAVLFSLLYTIVLPSWESYDSFQPSVKKRFSMQYDYSYLWWLLMCKHTTFLKTFKSRFSNEHIFQTHKFRKKKLPITPSNHFFFIKWDIEWFSNSVTLFENYSKCRIWILAFSTNFCPIKIARKLQFFKNSPNWPFLAFFKIKFCPLKM